jgi:hypothetical protein
MGNPILKKFLFRFIVVLCLQGCTTKIEIPVKHAGVVRRDEQVSAEVLKAGEHQVSFDSEVIIYDVNPTSLDTEFDFLFSDSSEGKLKIDVEFNPITDSLSSFYKKYHSISITSIVNQVMRGAVRNSLFKFSPKQLTKDEFEIEINNVIRTNPAIVNYVEIKSIDIVELN